MLGRTWAWEGRVRADWLRSAALTAGISMGWMIEYFLFGSKKHSWQRYYSLNLKSFKILLDSCHLQFPLLCAQLSFTQLNEPAVT